MRRLALTLVVASLLAGVAHAAVLQEPAPPVGVLAIGDFGVGGPIQRRVGGAMRSFEARNPAAVLVTLGDNDYTESGSAFARNWNESFGWLEKAGVVVAGSLGNHDVRIEQGRYELGTLGMPGPYYRRRFGDVELFLLNSNAVTPRQTRWLEQALQTSQARWKIAAFHHPAFTCGAYRSHALVVRRWVPLFERYGVQLVLSAHDHNYQRFLPRRGVAYLVHGGGGGGAYRLSRCPAGYPRRVRARTELGWLYLSAGADRLVGYAVDARGRRTDRFTVLP